VVLACALGACGSSTDEAAIETEQQGAVDDLGQLPVATQPEEPDESADTEPIATAGPESVEQESNQEDLASSVEAAGYEPEAPVVTHSFGPLAAGTHRLETLGTPVSFRTEERFGVQPNSGGWTVLTAENSVGPDDRDIVMMRATTLADPKALTTLDGIRSGWPSSDFSGWLDSVGPSVVVTNRQETSVGGFRALRADLKLGEIECGTARDCAYLVANNLQIVKGLNEGSTYRMWMVDQGEEAPLALIVGIDNDDDRDWFATAERVLSTVAFGDVAPNPLELYPAGPAELPMLGGVSIELFEDTQILEDTRGFFYIPSDFVPGGVEYLVNPLDLDDAPYGTTDALVDGLDARGVDSAKIGSATIDGFDARVFDIENRGREAEIMMSPDAELGWFSPPTGRLWIVEHPERGILILTAWGAGPDAATIKDEAIEYQERIIEVLEFSDAAG